MFPCCHWNLQSDENTELRPLFLCFTSTSTVCSVLLLKLIPLFVLFKRPLYCSLPMPFTSVFHSFSELAMHLHVLFDIIKPSVTRPTSFPSSIHIHPVHFLSHPVLNFRLHLSKQVRSPLDHFYYLPVFSYQLCHPTSTRLTRVGRNSKFSNFKSSNCIRLFKFLKILNMNFELIQIIWSVAAGRPKFLMNAKNNKNWSYWH